VAIAAGLLALGLATPLLPARWRRRLAARPWLDWLSWWTWRDSVQLALQRLTLFLLVLGYSAVGLALCRIPVTVPVVFGVIPFVLIAESLPGTGGLGERETALVYLLGADGEERAVLLSFGLIWSTVIILGRLAIGLVSWWLPEAETPEGYPTDGRTTRPGDTALNGEAIPPAMEFVTGSRSRETSGEV
jgi:hypothetical protein